MLTHEENHELRTRIAEVEAQRIPAREVLNWFAPWFAAAILVLIFLGALWCASGASDDLTYAIGIVGAVLALIAVIWEAVAALSGGLGDLSLQMLVEDDISLVVLMVLLAILALVGLALAAHGPSPTASGVGYGLCIFGVAFAFANIKHYFDRLERLGR
jgi:hypothetical protein